MDYKTEFAHERDHDYIGDGVYVSVDQFGQIWLRTQRLTHDGFIWEGLALEPEVFNKLVDYRNRVVASALTKAAHGLAEVRGRGTT